VAQIASIHSFRGGTGKSNITANLALLLARSGSRVGVVDTDINSPGIHVIFGLDEHRGPTLNDYLWGECSIGEAARPINLEGLSDGRLHLIPASSKGSAITRMLREGYEVARLMDGMRDLITHLELDWLFIDTHPGLNDETLLSITISDHLLIVLRPDRQDYLGTGVTVEVARKLNVPQLMLVLNKVPDAFDSDEVRLEAEKAYGAEVVGVLPHADEMMVLSSARPFVAEHPAHPLTSGLASIAARLTGTEVG